MLCTSYLTVSLASRELEDLLKGHLSYNLPLDAVSSNLSEAKPAESPPSAITSLKAIWHGFRREHAAFVVACIYLIFEYNKPYLIYPALGQIPWGKTLLLLALFLTIIDNTARKPPAAAIWPLLLFSISVLLSMVFSFSPSVALEGWTHFFSWVFVVLLITSVVNSRQRLFLFVVVYFLANFKMAQHGFRSWALKGFGFSGWGVTGSPGWFQNSGEFSLEMVVFLPLVLAYIATFRNDWSRWNKVFFYLLAVMVIGSIIATGSRGGILGLGVIGLWGVVFSRKRLKTFIIVSISIVVVYFAMPVELKERFVSAGNDTTSLSRLAYWQHGLQAIADNPITGIGFRNWTVWVEANYPEIHGLIGGRKVEVIHNTYLEAATELGLLGAMSYLVIILQIYITNHRTAQIARIRNDRFLEATATGLNGSLFAYLLPSYFMSVLYYPYIWMLLALTVSASYISSHRLIDQTDRSFLDLP